MACSAGALAAAITIDAGHAVVGGRTHQVLANAGFDAATLTLKADEMDL